MDYSKMSSEEIENELGEEALGTAIQIAVNGEESEIVATDKKESKPSQENQESEDSDGSDDQGEQKEDNIDGTTDQEEDQEIDRKEKFEGSESAKKAVTAKKNKRKDKAKEYKDQLEDLRAGNRDDDYETAEERDLAIIDAQSKESFANAQLDEVNEEITQNNNDFFDTTPHARENREAVEELMKNHGFTDALEAYTFHLSKTDPERLYDVHKKRQGKSYGMNGSSGGTAIGSKKFADLSTKEMESQLESAVERGEASY